MTNLHHPEDSYKATTFSNKFIGYYWYDGFGFGGYWSEDLAGNVEHHTTKDQAFQYLKAVDRSNEYRWKSPLRK